MDEEREINEDELQEHSDMHPTGLHGDEPDETEEAEAFDETIEQPKKKVDFEEDIEESEDEGLREFEEYVGEYTDEN